MKFICSFSHRPFSTWIFKCATSFKLMIGEYPLSRSQLRWNHVNLWVIIFDVDLFSSRIFERILDTVSRVYIDSPKCLWLTKLLLIIRWHFGYLQILVFFICCLIINFIFAFVFKIQFFNMHFQFNFELRTTHL